MTNSRYSHWDVMATQEEWDDHTRDVVLQRMQDPRAPRFLTATEAETLAAAAARLLGDDDPWRLAKVVEHVDGLLDKGPGNGYRKESQPPDREFWRRGLANLGVLAAMPPDQQEQVLKDLEGSDFFKALLKEVVSAYCALPPVWSFMGYGGPAFPRGYVRIELGARDPWEAKPDEA